MTSSLEHPYRRLYELALPAVADAPPVREVRVALGVLIGVSAIQLGSGAQIAAGLFGLSAGLIGLASTWRR